MPSAFVPIKIRPPAVTTGPLRWTRRALPVFLMPFSASARTVPSGARHAMVPSFKSYATSSAQGGPIARRPFFATNIAPSRAV